MFSFVSPSKACIKLRSFFITESNISCHLWEWYTWKRCSAYSDEAASKIMDEKNPLTLHQFYPGDLLKPWSCVPVETREWIFSIWKALRRLLWVWVYHLMHHYVWEGQMWGADVIVFLMSCICQSQFADTLNICTGESSVWVMQGVSHPAPCYRTRLSSPSGLQLVRCFSSSVETLKHTGCKGFLK